MERLLEEAMERLPGCVAAGIADVHTGGLLAAIAGDDAQTRRLEVAAAAGASILEGARAARDALALPLSPGGEEPLPREAMVVSSSGIHVIQRLMGQGEGILVVLCSRPPRFAGRILTEARTLAAQATPGERG